MVKSTKQWSKFPMSLDDNYKRRLKPIVDRIRSLYKEIIEPELKELLEFKYINTESLDDSIETKINKIFHKYTVNYYGQSFEFNGDPKTIEFRNKIENQINIESKSVARVHKKRFKKNYKFVLKVDPLKNEPFLPGNLRDWTAKNIGLIKDIPDFAINSMRNTVMESVMRGDSMTFLKEQLQKTMGASDRRLKLIARDQTNKLYGALTTLRSLENGWQFYEWSDSNDIRVRPDHRRLDGKIFKFTESPIVNRKTGQEGNPGDDIQCRCVALVMFEDATRFKKNIDGSYRLLKIKEFNKRIA